MSRNLFHRWAAGVPAGEFAKALAAVGLEEPGRPPSYGKADAYGAYKARFEEKTRLLRLEADAIDTLARELERSADFAKQVPPAAHYAGLWDALLKAVLGNGPAPRLTVVGPRHDQPLMFGAGWLSRELSRPEVGATAVSILREAPGLEVGWNWPMRVGVLAGRPSAALRPLLAGHPWQDRFQVVLAGGGERECDLLLLDGSLRAALAQALSLPGRFSADCVVVLGGRGTDESQAVRLLSSLAAETRASGIAIADVDNEAAARKACVERLFREIAHDKPLDVALWEAARAAGAPAPFFSATENLLRFAQVTQTASRMAAHLDALGEAASARALEHVVRTGAFVHEDHDSFRVAEIRRGVEALRAAPLRMAKKNGAPAPAPMAVPAKPPEEERRVNFDLFDEEAPGQRLAKPLARGRSYRLEVFIGFPRAEGSADGPIPLQQLPPGGHRLRVLFVPLTRDDHGEIAPPQSATIWLPAKGESDKARFSFDTAARSARLDARIIVAFKNRVIQTLVFSSGIESDPRPRLAIESVAATDLDQLAYRSPVDASIVVNHSPAGVPGITALSGEGIRYQELDDRLLVEEIRKSLKELAARKQPFTTLDDPQLREHLYTLAKDGRKLWREVGPELRDLLANASALQVIDARPGAYLPIEFFFEGVLPGAEKKLCPNAARFLDEPETPHRECEHYGESEYLCPLRFWGFQRVIERQAVYATDKDAGSFRLKSPAPNRPRIEAFKSALVAFSDKVEKADQAKVLDALGTHKVAQVSQAADWTKWRKLVADNSPTLLLLLPHSDHPTDSKGRKTKDEALEIGGKLLALDDFDVEDIAGPGSPNPVVFLLGCSTNLVEIPFANFVSYARKLEASLVLGTLAPVSGHRAAVFVAAMLEALAKAKNAPFGETFLRLRRQLLADGNGFALALVAYGDIDWIV